jgi:1,2-phenylacetyl-CoA epoxidase catalytic subunit
MFFKELLSYLSCSQIWLNLLVDHCHFDYITNSTKKEWLDHSPELKKDLKKKLLPYSDVSQIWLNLSTDHHHFGYIYY